eukprot:scaffold270327_cov34-Attheya_sp.AAC.1
MAKMCQSNNDQGGRRRSRRLEAMSMAGEGNVACGVARKTEVEEKYHNLKEGDHVTILCDKKRAQYPLSEAAWLHSFSMAHAHLV